MTPALLALAVAAAASQTPASGSILTLDEALARARAHPRVAQSEAAVSQAQARSREVFAGFLPAASATASYERATSNVVAQEVTAVDARGNPVTLRPSDATTPSYGAALNVQVPIWDFGRTLGQVRAARASESAARADLVVARLDVDVQVKTAYLGALAAEALVQVADDAIAQMQKHLDFAQASLDVGRRTRFDVTRALVDLTNARITKIQAENGVATARASLSSAIGEPVADARLVVPASQDAADPRPEAAVERALAARPEIAALDRRIRAAEEGVASARSAWLPVLVASGQYRFGGSDFPLVRNWNVGATLAWPFLAGGADEARLSEQHAALEQARAARDIEVLQVRADVEQTALAVIESHARRDASRVLVGQASENLELAEGRYQAGVGSIVDLVDAQAALTSARAQEVRAGYDLATAWARLVRAIGDS